MTTSIKRLFGERVAVQLVDEEYDGMIVPAPSALKMHMVSNVIAIGDKTKLVKPGDRVYWQWNQMIESFCKFNHNGSPMFVLHEKDLIARLDSTKVNIDSFHVLGDWCLVRKVTSEKSGRIFIPHEAQEAPDQTFIRHYLVQKGEDSIDRPMEVEDELIIDRSKANPVRLGGLDFYYVQKLHVVGVYGPP